MTTQRDIGDFTTDPDGIRDAKELIATLRTSIAALWGFHAGVLTSVSGTNEITASVEVTQGFSALTNGLSAVLIPANTNTGAVEINVHSLGLKDIKTPSGDALSAGALVAGTRALIVFDSDNDYWWLLGSSGTTQVTVTGGLQVKRSEPGRLLVEVAASTALEALMTRSFQCTYATSRVIIEGQVSKYVGSGSTDADGFEIQLFKDNVLVETITDAVVGDSHTNNMFYFSHLPGDTDSHTYEIRASSTIAATYPVSANWMIATEMSPN